MKDYLLANFYKILHLRPDRHGIVITNIKQTVHRHILNGAGMDISGMSISPDAAMRNDAKAQTVADHIDNGGGTGGLADYIHIDFCGS